MGAQGASHPEITCQGLERSRKANWKHGHYSAVARAERLGARAALRALRLSFGSWMVFDQSHSAAAGFTASTESASEHDEGDK